MGPRHFILNAKRKAYKIHQNKNKNKNKNENDNNSNPTNSSNRSPADRYLILPNNNISTELGKHLYMEGLRIANTTSDTIRQLLNKPKHVYIDPEAGIYQIPCSTCDKSYFGQTSRSISKRIAEHKRDLKYDVRNNSIVKHSLEENHSPDFGKARIIKYANNLRLRQILESAIISTYRNYNHRPGAYNLAKNISNKILEENNIKIPTLLPTDKT